MLPPNLFGLIGLGILLPHSPIPNLMMSFPGSRPPRSGQDGHYQVRAEIADPNIQQLRSAGTQYPQWVKDRYLEIPENIKPEIQTLAEKISGTAG